MWWSTAAVAGPSRCTNCSIGGARSAIKASTSQRQSRSFASSQSKQATPKSFATVPEAVQQSLEGYNIWKEGEGQKFARHKPGQKAQWLDDRSPFPLNPSFRPPPPLSNVVQERIYGQILKGDKNYATLSTDYGVSKARIDAIRKLKEVEREFKRQSLPLQVAFQNGMEALLDMKPPVDKATGQYNERTAREESRLRSSSEAYKTELDEEKRHDAGHGAHGSFGEPVTVTNRAGIERTVWEWRDEDDVVAVEMAQREAEEAAKKAREESDAIEESGSSDTVFGGPAQKLAAKQSQKLSERPDPNYKSYPSKILPSLGQKAAFRFVDVSSEGVKQVNQVAGRAKAREKAHKAEQKRLKLRKEERDRVRREMVQSRTETA